MIWEPGIILTGALAIIGGGVWAVRLEGRVNGHEKLFEEREKLANERHEDLKEALNRIQRTVDGIGRRRDREDNDG